MRFQDTMILSKVTWNLYASWNNKSILKTKQKWHYQEPPIQKWHFQAPYTTKGHFQDPGPPIQKWHFRDPLYSKIEF